jgi:hypothetical protein
MYDPRLPNSYDSIAAAKRKLRQEVEAAAAARVAEEAQKGQYVDEHDAAAAVAAGAPMDIDMAPEALRRHRVEASARLGVQSAIEMQREEHEANLRERKALGLDSGSKAKNFLKKLGVTEGQGLTGAGGSGLASHLVLEKANLAAGGNVLVEGAGPAKPVVKGRPSSTLLLRNVTMSRPIDEFALAMDIQNEASKHGVVKAVRVFPLPELPEGWAPGELTRVLVRFDTVASAFKAAEALNQRLYDGRHIFVSFYSTAVFDRSEYGPSAEEDRLPT